MNNLAEQLSSIKLSTSNPLPMDEAIQHLIASFEADVETNDLMVEKLEEQENEINYLKGQVANLSKSNSRLLSENEELATTLKNYEKDAAEVISNAEKNLQKIEQERRERDQAKNESKDLKIQLKAFKEIAASPKKVREKIKTLQDNVTKQRNAAETQKKNYLQERKDHEFTKKKLNDVAHKLAVSNISQAYSDGNDVVALFPHQLGEGIEGFEAGQIPLLYMHRSGRGGLILLNEDGEAEFVKSPKGGLKPKASTLDHCGVLLRRFKSQNWTLTNQDVEAIAQGSNL